MLTLLPPNACIRNQGGSMFVGCIASLAHPIPAQGRHRQFPAHVVRAHEQEIDFRRPELADLAAVETIEDELQRHQRSTPGFASGL
ncbi:MAG: hypothetical protein P8098_02700 [Candidatus Thiodiazotropha sp.]